MRCACRTCGTVDECAPFGPRGSAICLPCVASSDRLTRLARDQALAFAKRYGPLVNPLASFDPDGAPLPAHAPRFFDHKGRQLDGDLKAL